MEEIFILFFNFNFPRGPQKHFQGLEKAHYPHFRYPFFMKKNFSCF